MTSKEELEQIEKELGIDLITLFKASKVIYVRNYDEKIRVYYKGEIFINFSNKQIYLYSLTTHLYSGYVNFKDYGKTWALTGKELENDK